MTVRLTGFTIMYGLMFASPVFCQTPEAEVAVDDKDLLAFVQLGNFSDRGIAAILAQRPNRSDVNAEAKSEAEITVPRDLLELLEVREKNAAQESRELPWPLDVETRWPLDVEKHKPEAAIDRFRKHGLIELFLNENTKLLDYPLTRRKELINRIKILTEQIATTLAAPYSRVLTESELIIVAAHIRMLSVQVDTEIMKSLSPAERARISKLVSYLLPSVIAEAKQSNRKYALGSAIFETYRLGGGTSEK